LLARRGVALGFSYSALGCWRCLPAATPFPDGGGVSILGKPGRHWPLALTMGTASRWPSAAQRRWGQFYLARCVFAARVVSRDARATTLAPYYPLGGGSLRRFAAHRTRDVGMWRPPVLRAASRCAFYLPMPCS